MKRKLFYTKGLFSLLLAVVFLSACGKNAEQPTATVALSLTSTLATTSPEVSASATITPFQEPLVASVNGRGISLSTYESQLSLYQLASGLEPGAEDRQRVLEDLIDQELLAQAAADDGFSVDEGLLQTRLEVLQTSLGSEAALAQWIDDHGFTTVTFKASLSKAIAAAWMRDRIIGQVPKITEQVHARQILVYESNEAQDILAQLQAGNDFGNLAYKYDPVTGGDLGWFPRGYLPNSELEAAAFDLQPRQFSQVIQTVAGFHILQVVEREPQYPLSPDALLTLQTLALRNWLEEHREQADVQILIP